MIIAAYMYRPEASCKKYAGSLIREFPVDIFHVGQFSRPVVKPDGKIIVEAQGETDI